MSRTPLPLRVLWNAFYWTYERATWQYDVMAVSYTHLTLPTNREV